MFVCFPAPGRMPLTGHLCENVDVSTSPLICVPKVPKCIHASRVPYKMEDAPWSLSILTSGGNHSFSQFLSTISGLSP